jgi:flavin reductase (DIM6/NTAB) family NADH-FMN oxidoreductase RutF
MRVPVPLRDAYRLLNHGPTTLVTTCAVDGTRPNVMAAAWAMPLDFEPPKVAVVIASGTLTRELLDLTNELALSLPTVAQLDATYLVGSKSGREVAKWGAGGFVAEKASLVRPPLVAGCVGWLECKALLEPDVRREHDLVIAEVVAAWADDLVYKNREWRFEPGDPRRTIHHLAHGTFFATGERLEARKP